MSIFINMKITEKQLRRIIRENVDDILDKISKGDQLTPSDKRKLDTYSKHLQSGGTERNFEYDDQPYEDDYRGKNFKFMVNNKPLIFKFDERQVTNEGVEYYGEISYNGDDYIGGIFTDSNGYLVDFDFYNKFESDLEEERLQDILKGQKYELENFFQEEVIPNLSV